MTKRIFDVVVAIVGLVLTFPVSVAIAIVIKATDRGPVFYRQIRVGQYGRPFRIVKFRTMRVNADKMGPSITARGDPRITPIGRVLRRSKLDELPQLWNVLVGEMSFVGPRPEVQKYVDQYTEEQRQVLELKPGITDEASLAFRDEEKLLAAAEDPEKFYIEHCMNQKIALNLAYARRRRGLASDLAVIWRTIAAVWLRQRSESAC